MKNQLKILVPCHNPKCPVGKFAPNSSEIPEGVIIARAGEAEAKSYVLTCPHCGTQNKVWFKNLPKVDKVTLGGKTR